MSAITKSEKNNNNKIIVVFKLLIDVRMFKEHWEKTSYKGNLMYQEEGMQVEN